MKKIHIPITLIVLFSVALSACGIAAPPPTPTPQPSNTPVPTSTPTPVPTPTTLGQANMPIPLTNTPTQTLGDVFPGMSGCLVSSDKTYGYTQENPIKVGGDFLEGPARERAYLDNLTGPNGETISYNRTGSVDFGDTILDVFDITGLGKQITLYIDEYSFTEPLAPVGFSCLGSFSVSAP